MFFLPFLLAAASAFTGYSSYRSQQRAGKRAEQEQRASLQRQEQQVAAQEQRAKQEKERLQMEESDTIRGARRRGRRSLLSGDETGVTSGLRTTLG